MSERGLFRGYALNAIDAKGRVAIPAPFRKTIERKSNESVLVIGKHADDACLTGYDMSWADELQARIERDEARALDAGRSFDIHNSNRLANTLTEDLGFDASGRFIMPSFFRGKAEIGDWVLFLGTGNVFEMWNPHLLLKTATVDEDIKDLARHLLNERGVAA